MNPNRLYSNLDQSRPWTSPIPTEQQGNGTLFSFIIPFYNCSDYLERALNSILRELDSDCEIILVDDGSTEDMDFLPRLLRQRPFIQLIVQANAGPGAARNAGATVARGKYLWFLDCDDELLPKAVSCIRQAIRLHPNAAMIVSGHLSHTSDGKDTPHPAPPLTHDQHRNFLAFIEKRLGSFSHGAVIVKRKVFEHIQYPVSIRNNEDLVFHAQVLANHTCISVSGFLVRIYIRANSLRQQDMATNSATLVAECLFEPGKIPQNLHPYKRRFTAGRELSRFRSLYKKKRYAEAKQSYIQAVRTSTYALLRWSYLSKFLRILYRTH